MDTGRACLTSESSQTPPSKDCLLLSQGFGFILLLRVPAAGRRGREPTGQKNSKQLVCRPSPWLWKQGLAPPILSEGIWLHSCPQISSLHNLNFNFLSCHSGFSSSHWTCPVTVLTNILIIWGSHDSVIPSWKCLYSPNCFSKKNYGFGMNFSLTQLFKI